MPQRIHLRKKLVEDSINSVEWLMLAATGEVDTKFGRSSTVAESQNVFDDANRCDRSLGGNRQTQRAGQFGRRLVVQLPDGTEFNVGTGFRTRSGVPTGGRHRSISETREFDITGNSTQDGLLGLTRRVQDIAERVGDGRVCVRSPWAAREETGRKNRNRPRNFRNQMPGPRRKIHRGPSVRTNEYRDDKSERSGKIATDRLRCDGTFTGGSGTTGQTKRKSSPVTRRRRSITINSLKDKTARDTERPVR